MEQTSRTQEHLKNSTPKHTAQTTEEIAREILDYSLQKDSYQGQHIEGNYLIAYLVDKARWLHYQIGGKLFVAAPRTENAYIGIAVHRNSDLSFIDQLSVSLTVLDAKGNLVGQQQQIYHPRPGMHHYGSNWTLPGDGLYTLCVRIDALERKWQGDVDLTLSPGIAEVEFPNVMIHTGRHIS